MGSAERFYAPRRTPALSFEHLRRVKVMVDQIPRRAVSMCLRRPLRRRKLYRVLIAFAADFADEKVSIPFEKPDHSVRSRVYAASYRKLAAVPGVPIGGAYLSPRASDCVPHARRIRTFTAH